MGKDMNEIDDGSDTRSQIRQKYIEMEIIQNKLNNISCIDDEHADIQDISYHYSLFSKSLGDIIKRDLEDVLSAKSKINKFKNDILIRHKEKHEKRLNQLQKEINKLKTK